GEESTGIAIYNRESNKWITEIPLSSHANPGEYKITAITLSDNASHTKIYWSGQDFNVFFNVTKN
ncbi:S-layer homology domain-containing protein, partial [Bacillus mycoides]